MPDSSLRRAVLASFVAASITGALACASPAARAADVRLHPWPARQPTPPLRLQDLEGRGWDLAQLRGKVVIVNFWASWCGPCVDEMPLLAALARQDPARVAVVGVNYKEGMDAIARFGAGHPFTYPVLRDRDGAAFAAWTGGVMPTTILVDARGRARWRSAGQIDADDTRLAAAIAALLSRQAAPQANNKHSTTRDSRP